MYVTLFSLTGIASIAWLLLILLPNWRFTRRMAELDIFPVYLAMLYVTGIVPLLVTLGPGIVQDFVNAAGVIRLLARQDVALIAWIHILTFDQVVGFLIYRDNMDHRYVPIPVQSLLLFFTFMFGPVGYLAYYVLRLKGRNRRSVASSELHPGALTRDAETDRPHPYGPSVRSVLRMLTAAWGAERGLFWTGIIGLVLGLAGLIVMAAHGRVIAPEGDLGKPISFDFALGIYLLTIALLVPLAGFSVRGARRWRRAHVTLMLGAFAIENIQIYRGLDPRFTRFGSAADRGLGGVFFLIALSLIALFMALAMRLFRKRAESHEALLLLGIRYGCVATMVAFAAGVWMSFAQGSRVGESGNMLSLHAFGFHGLQAVPMVALLLGWARKPSVIARRSVHVAGAAWLAACAAIAWQTLKGRVLLEVSPATIAGLAMLLVWLLVTGRAAGACYHIAPALSVRVEP